MAYAQTFALTREQLVKENEELREVLNEIQEQIKNPKSTVMFIDKESGWIFIRNLTGLMDAMGSHDWKHIETFIELGKKFVEYYGHDEDLYQDEIKALKATLIKSGQSDEMNRVIDSVRLKWEVKLYGKNTPLCQPWGIRMNDLKTLEEDDEYIP